MIESLETLRQKVQALGPTGQDILADLKRAINETSLIQRRVDVLERIGRIGASMSRIETNQDVDEVLSDILSNAIELSRAGRGFIVLSDEDEPDGFAIRASRMGEGAEDDSSDNDGSDNDMRISRSLIKTILQNEQGIVTTDAQQDERFERSATMMVANIRSVMATPIRLHGKVIGGIYVDSQIADYLFDDNDLKTLSSFADNAAVTFSLATSLKTRRDFNVQSVRALVNAVEAADAYTAGHSSRVGYYAKGIATQMALGDDHIDNLMFAGYLHDVGKIALSLPVGKEGPLNDAEWEEMRKHTLYGVRILEDSPALEHLLPAVRSHHEKWRGGGYPDGISGEAIHMYARLVAVADAFDAMTTDRPYRKAYSTDYALSEIDKGQGELYYPDAAQAFLSAFERENLLLAAGLDRPVLEHLVTTMPKAF
ncbi:MAG: HD domain-containing phosphohydrolase [Deinococcota bacterium]